jgi:hypothetical protein
MSLPWQQIFRFGMRVIKSSGAMNPVAVVTTVTNAVGGAGAAAALAARFASGAWRVATVPVAIVIGAVGLTLEKRLRAGEPPPTNADATWALRERRQLEQARRDSSRD